MFCALAFVISKTPSPTMLYLTIKQRLYPAWNLLLHVHSITHTNQESILRKSSCTEYMPAGKLNVFLMSDPLPFTP